MRIWRNGCCTQLVRPLDLGVPACVNNSDHSNISSLLKNCGCYGVAGIIICRCMLCDCANRHVPVFDTQLFLGCCHVILHHCLCLTCFRGARDAQVNEATDLFVARISEPDGCTPGYNIFYPRVNDLTSDLDSVRCRSSYSIGFYITHPVGISRYTLGIRFCRHFVDLNYL